MLTSGIIAQGRVIFQLANIGTGNPVGITGTSIIPNLKYTAMTAQDGTFSIPLWGNDNINPANTVYSVTFRDFLGNELGPVFYSITGTLANLNSLTAVSATVPPVLSVGGASILASASFLNQSISLPLTTIFTPVTGTFPGLYRLNLSLIVTSIGTLGTVLATISYGSGFGAGSRSTATLNLNQTSTDLGQTFIFRQVAASPVVAVSTTVTGAGGSPLYSLFVKLENLGP